MSKNWYLAEAFDRDSYDRAIEKELGLNKKTQIKKVGKDFVGVCELRQLPKGTYFRTIDKNGKMSKETYTKSYYERSLKKFQCDKCSDIWGNGRMIKGTQKVTTDFYY